MTFALVGFLSFCFVGMTLINRILEGQFITGSDVAILNQMSIWGSLDLGFFSIPVPNVTYITGLFHLVSWDYSFFGGNAQIIQFFLYTLTFALSVAFLLIIVGILWNAIRVR